MAILRALTGAIGCIGLIRCEVFAWERQRLLDKIGQVERTEERMHGLKSIIEQRVKGRQPCCWEEEWRVWLIRWRQEWMTGLWRMLERQKDLIVGEG